MIDTSDVDRIRGLYAAFARGDVPSVLAGFHPDIEWNEAENFPYADRNPYRGPASIATSLFSRLAADWDELRVVPAEFMAAVGSRVVVCGRYRGMHRATRRQVDAQFAHVWTLRSGWVVRFQQYTDTLQFARVAGP
jgi:hypothetical protein